MSEKIIFNVASYKRTDSLIKSLKSIIDQCDEINVALNDHYDTELPEFLYHPKINIFYTDNSLGDAFKFLNLENSDGYFFTIDDDLIYPPTYVSDTIKKCNEYGNKKVITYHGRSFKSFPISSYYRSATERYACLEKVKNDEKVQFGGTGVMCFHTSLMKVPIEYFKYPNMADVWIGKYCLQNNIDIMCLKHEKGYIKYIPQKITIYEVESKNDSLQTSVVNSIFDGSEISETPKNLRESKPHEKIIPTIEKKHNKINYDKVNSIFGTVHQSTPKKTQIVQENIKPKTNSDVLKKLMSKSRKR